jgi:hypothetical protein
MPTNEPSQASNSKRTAQIASTFSSESSHFYQRLSDYNTGEIKVRENTKPSTGYSKTVITGKPCSEEEAESSYKRKKDDETSAVEKVGKWKSGYDASQL